MLQVMDRPVAGRLAPTASWSELVRDLPTIPGGSEPLTPAEQAVAHCLRQGLSNREIAARLGKSIYTVKNQVHAILNKSGARSRMRYVTAGPA